MKILPLAAKYAQPEVVAFWTEFSRQGLQIAEATMLTRYAPPPARVLDLGCGAGRASLALTPQGYTVVGLDLIPEMLGAAQALHTEAGLPARFIQADLQALPCAPASFDVILIFIAAFQHLPSPAARSELFATLSKILRPSGRLILALDNLAPALTCYAWWAWNKLRNGGRVPRPPLTAERRSPADAHLESRRGHMLSLVWHLRGLARSAQWRTWPGMVDGLRQLRLLPGAIGDTAINQVSLKSTPGFVHYHIYRHTELLAEISQHGFHLLGYHAARELAEAQTFPPRIRQLDKQILYAFQRPAFQED